MKAVRNQPVFEAVGKRLAEVPLAQYKNVNLGNPRKSEYIYRYSRNWNFANPVPYTITGKQRDLARFGEAA